MEIINLDMTPSTVTPNAHAGQYDSARTVRFMLKNGGVPFTLAGTETITAEITRSDNTEVTVNVENTSSNYVDVVFDDTVCTVKGLYACELRLKDSDGFDIGSKNFALLVQRDPYDNKNVHIVTVGPADICTFETTLPEPYQSVLVNVLATGGNGTPDNPNPINGYTKANITRCGVNLYSNIFSEYRKPVNYYIKNIPLKVGTTYTIKAELKSGGTAQNNVAFGVANKGEQYSEFDSRIMCITIGGTTSTITFTPTSTWTLPKLICYVSGETEFEDVFDNYEITLVEGSSATYTPYTGNTYTIAFGQTVYGGVLDVTRGKLRVKKAIVDIGDIAWIYYAPYKLFIHNMDGMKSGPNKDLLCSCFKSSNTWPSEPDYDDYDNVILRAGNDSNFRIKCTAYTDGAVFQTAMAGQKIAYELATPFDIDLTPEVISAIVGTNNVFADCGQSTVKYLKAGT